jgi:hypothetical protein
MNIQATVSRNVQNRLGQNQTVGGDNHYIGILGPECFLRFWRFQGLGLKNRNTCTQRHLFDRAGDKLAAAARRAIRLSINTHDFMGCLKQ